MNQTRKNYYIRQKINSDTIEINYNEPQLGNYFDFEKLNIEIENKIENLSLYYFLISLTNKQRFIFYYYYIHNLSDEEIASKMSVTKQAVNKARRKLLEKAKNNI